MRKCKSKQDCRGSLDREASHMRLWGMPERSGFFVVAGLPHGALMARVKSRATTHLRRQVLREIEREGAQLPKIRASFGRYGTR
jgi:hypothetical protein